MASALAHDDFPGLAGEPLLNVSWLDEPPAWLDRDDVRAVLGSVAIAHDGGNVSDEADVVHVGAASIGRLRDLRRERSDRALVLDLCGDGEDDLSWRAARSARAADLILVGSLSALKRLRRRQPELAERTALLVRPVDLDTHAPLEQLHKVRDAQVKRFRRLHRLVGPVVLFGGSYTQSGGLDLALEAVYRMRERLPELRLAAVPHGRVDRDYLDRCERRALALGHHGIIEWDPEPTDVPLWYGVASVVCAPAREAAGATPAKLAAAAGTPFVASDVEGLAEHVVEGTTGFLVAPCDVDALTAALEALVGDADEGTRIGSDARAWAEGHLSPVSAAKHLQRLWIEGAGRGARFAPGRPGDAA